MQTHRARRSVVVFASVMVLSLGAPLAAQQTTPVSLKTQAPQTTQTTPAAPAGPTLNLSMDQAVAMALETNLGLKSSRVNLAMASQTIAGARAAFKPLLTSNFSRNTSTKQPQSFTESTASSVSNGSVSVNTGWGQALPWFGSQYSVNWSGSRSTTTAFTSFNPQLGSNLTLGFTQPLWRNFTIDPARANLESAERGHEIADLTLQQSVLTTQDAVRNAYLNLIGAIASLEVATQNREIAQKGLINAQARIRVGQGADIDQIQADASLLSSEDAVIFNEQQRATAEDQLRTLILDPSRPDFWTIHLKPTDELSTAARAIDVDAAINSALANRLDLLTTRRNMELTSLNVRLGENQVHPQVDFNLQYSASTTGGTILNFDPNSSVYPPPLLSTTTKGFGSVLGDTFGGTYPSWAFGVRVQYPVGQSAQKASLARTRLVQEQQAIDLHNQELGVAQQVRQAARLVESGYRRVESGQKAVEANKRQLAAEESRQAVGFSTTFDVIQKQQALFNAQQQYLQALIGYNQALVLFDKVQKIR